MRLHCASGRGIGWGPMNASCTALERHVDRRVERIAPAGRFDITNNSTVPTDTKKKSDVVHPGMMGDGTEEQNLNERGDPKARIEEDELDAAFGSKNPKK
jgi:hypothetical protein